MSQRKPRRPPGAAPSTPVGPGPQMTRSPGALEEGAALHRAGDLAGARARYASVLEGDPGNADALHLLGVIAIQDGDHAAALDLVGRAIARNPGSAAFHTSLGQAYARVERPEDAEASYREALRLQPDLADTHFKLGNLLRGRNRQPEAERCYRSALVHDPGLMQARINLGNLLRDRGALEAAESCYRDALARQPEYAEARINLGVVLKARGRPAEAIEEYRAALRLRSELPQGHCNLGNALQALLRPAEAIAAYREALRLKPDYADAHLNFAMALLLAGEFEEGWREYEWRWQCAPALRANNLRRDFTQPAWDGEDVSGRRVLLQAEQGYGDAIQFARLAAHVARRGATVIVECQPELKRLFAGSRDMGEVVARGEPLPPFDLHCPLLSLARVLRFTPATASSAVPYLAAESASIARWRARTAGDEGGLRVGLAWAGEPEHGNDRNRSLPLAALAPLGAVAGVTFYSLQKGPAAAQAGTAPPGTRMHDFTRELGDFADTAALITNLDLVITVDTAVAHLAGALGKPVWTLLPFVPDWRWRLDRDDSDWYPTMRLFRQDVAGDWSAPVERVAKALSGIARTRRAAAARPATPDAAAVLQQAYERYRAADLDAAERLAWRSVAKNPADADVLGLLAAVRLARKDFPAAEHWARQALQFAPASPQLHVSLGFAVRSQGRLAEAIECYRAAVALQPDYAEGWHRLAQALRAAGEREAARNALDRALVADPDYAPAWATSGHLYHDTGRTEEAIAAYGEAVRRNPGNAEANVGLGTALHAAGRYEEAVSAHEVALRLRSDFPEAHNNLANALRSLGRVEDALTHYREALRIRPGYHEALLNCGLALQETGRTDQAIESFKAAIAARPENPDAHMALGTAYQDRSSMAEAEPCYREALRIRPAYPDALSNLGVALQELGRLEEALSCHEQALRLNPGNPDVLVNLGVTLKECGRLDEAIARYEEALSLRPGLEGGLINLGAALNDQGRLPEALDTYQRAVAQNPGSPEAHWNNSLALLLKGDYEQGWREYEWRWDSVTAKRAKVKKPQFVQPEWQGGALPGQRRILLVAEQGYGDAIQFARYVPLLARSGAQVSVQCHRELTRVFHGLEGVHRVLPFGGELPEFDCWCPMLSLALAFGTRVATIPCHAPYLSAETDKLAHWRSMLAADRARLKVGIVWAGRPEHRNDRNRSMSLDRLAPLATIEGVSFYSLQKGAPAVQAAQPPAGMQLTDVSVMLEDFADTAALIAQLDLVITVDTAVLHLAGALGKAAWVLVPFSPDWRWLMQREDTPWYPTVRLFRQPRPRDWEPVVASVAEALRQEAAARPPAPPAQDTAPSLAYGIACHRAGRLDEAATVYRRLLENEPRHADALHLAGVIATQRGQNTDAERSIRTAIEINPRAPEYWNSLGNVLRQLDRAEDAEAAYREGLRLNTGYAEAHNNLGLLLKSRGELDGAHAAIREALRLQPNYPEGHVNLGNTLQALGRFEEAVAAYQEALKLRPRYPEALMNLGNALQRQGRLTEAVAKTREALNQRPDYADAHMNLGHAFQSQGRLPDALSCYRAALALRPDYAEAHWNYSLALLLAGDLREGFREYEWRWRWQGFPSPRRDFAQPQWRGEDLSGKVILLHAEQVFGDTIHFIRYAPLVAARGARVVVECQHELIRLFARIPGIAQLVAQGAALPRFDFHCPLLSLPLAFDHDLASVPGSVPYLEAEAQDDETWRQRAGDGYHVGVVWAGSPLHKNDLNRSVSLTSLGALARVPGIVFHSLQKGEAARQSDTPPAGMRLVDHAAELGDFTDTAALIARLDLVICVDTAVGHLAGALGKPVWIMLPCAPDWRWLLERDDSPWYPTARLFRQKSWGDWNEVIERVVQALAQQVGAPAAAAAPVENAEEVLKRAAHLHREGNYGEAETLYRRVLAQDPNAADAWHLLGVALRQLKRIPEAQRCIHRALALRPGIAQFHASLGNVHKDIGESAAAIDCYREALRLKPDYSEAHFNLGSALHASKRFDEALDHFREATRHNPEFAEAWYNQGNVLQDRDRYDEAQACYERAIDLKPGDARAHSNLGTVHIQEGRLAAALSAFEAAIAADGGSADAHWNLSLALLLMGRFERGWREYEWRWKTADGERLERRFPQPRWAGQDPGGRRILLHAEQGLGDAIQFVRYAALLAARGATVIVESRPETARLFKRAAGVAEVVTAGTALPEIHFQCPLLSLPGAFGTTLETVPHAVPYLSAEPDLADHWRQRILAGAPGLRVGLAWAGRPEHPHDRFRSIALESLAPLLAVPGVTWYSLQKSAPGARFPAAGKDTVVDFTADLGDFADTAALVSQLDLVICVDTSVAHLAGALGRPVWVLLAHAPDWRWLLSREDSVWYPTMRLFRQERLGHWQPVVESAARALVSAASDKTGRHSGR